MFKLLGGFAAMMASATAGAGQGGPNPIYVVAEPVPEGLRIKVIGASEAAYDAAFSLEVTSAGNRSLHRGSAQLRGGGPTVLSTVTLGNAAPGQWRAHLRVEPSGRDPYEQIKTSLE